MNRQMLILCGAALLLMGASAGFLSRVNGHQQLAPPGVRTHPLADSVRLEADLPERVSDYSSEVIPVDDITLAVLPKDTSFGFRRYKGPGGFTLDLRVVLMGRDRTSMHKPQICLTGEGWRIDEVASSETRLHVSRPFDYDLPVVKLIAHTLDAQSQPVSGVYVYWYVADDALSASTSGFQRMWLMAKKLLTTGVLQRWSYVSCFAQCAPGQESATYERMAQFISAAVPEFQIYPRSRSDTIAAAQ